MNTRKAFRIMAVVVIALMTLAVAGPAYADTHYNDVIPIEGNSILVAGIDTPCAFDIAAHTYGKIHANYWVDENGNGIRELDSYGDFKDVLSYNGKTVNIQMQGPVHSDFRNNTVIFRSTGSQNIMTIPGHGKVFGGGGQVIWTPDQVIFRGNFEWDWGPVCAYLGS